MIIPIKIKSISPFFFKWMVTMLVIVCPQFMVTDEVISVIENIRKIKILKLVTLDIRENILWSRS